MHYTSTSMASNMITGITSQKYEKGWMLTKEQKNAFLGSAGSIRAGGATEESEKSDRPTFENDLIPACWHSMPREFFEELIHSFGLKAVFVATVMDDNAAMACIVSGTPAVMMLFSEEQRTLLRERLLKLIWLEFRNPQSKLYEAALSKVIGAAKQDKDVARTKKSTPKKGRSSGDKRNQLAAALKKGAKKDNDIDEVDPEEKDNDSRPAKAKAAKGKAKAKDASKKRKVEEAQEDDELDSEEELHPPHLPSSPAG